MSYPPFTQFVVDLCDNSTDLTNFRKNVLAVIGQQTSFTLAQIDALLSEDSNLINTEIQKECSFYYVSSWRKVTVVPSAWVAGPPSQLPEGRTAKRPTAGRASKKKR